MKKNLILRFIPSTAKKTAQIKLEIAYLNSINVFFFPLLSYFFIGNNDLHIIMTHNMHRKEKARSKLLA